MSIGAFLTIALIHLAAAISPGPSFIVSVRTAAAQGYRPAIGLAFGFGLGAAIWALAALTGLSLIFEVLPWLMNALKICGAAFLIWLAVNMWRHADQALDTEMTAKAPRSFLSAVRLGVFTQLANPKPAIFFGAVFIGLVPAAAPLWQKALLLAVIFADETLWYILVARLFSGRRAREAYGRAKAATDRAFGGLMALLAIRIASS